MMQRCARLALLAIPLIVVLGCRLGQGPDSIFSGAAYTGGARPSCAATCHNGTVAPDPMLAGGSGTAGKHIAHVSTLGLACEKCHFAYRDTAAHMDGTLQTAGMVRFDTTNPVGQWTSQTGPQTGSCASLACHGNITMDWYGSAPPGSLECVACHSYPIGRIRQVTGAQGDFAANASIKSHHVAGASDPTSVQCKVCHDQSTHTQGTVHLRQADTGAILSYSAASPAGLEPFCLSCHDANGALAQGAGAKTPFLDGRTLGGPPPNPNMAGDKIAGYWNSANTVHKARGLSCAGSGLPGTGCHGNGGAVNMHGSVSQGLLTKNMTLHLPASVPYTADDYRLCFDCHDSYPAVSKETVLGYRQGGNYDLWWAPTPFYTAGITSLFRDRYIALPGNYPPAWAGANQPYNDNFWGDPYTPLHNYHLSPTDSGMQNIWSYRGTTAGRASCTTCHNVHGTAGASVRSTWDELGIQGFTGVGSDAYKKLVPSTNYDDPVLKSYPVNCSVSCHGIAGATSYWHTPSGE